MTSLIAVLVVWFISIPVSYVLMRRDMKAITGQWKRIDRMAALGLALASGPMMAFVCIVSAIFDKVSATAWAKREARW